MADNNAPFMSAAMQNAMQNLSNMAGRGAPQGKAPAAESKPENEPKTMVINGRMHRQAQDGLYDSVPISMDEARAFKQDPPARQYVDDKTGKAFEVVDGKSYGDKLQENGAETVMAQKVGQVMARMGVPGEKLDVWSENGIKESPQTVQEGSVVLTKVGNDGKPVIDDYGHTNTWQTKEETFRKKYEVPEGPIKEGVFDTKKGMEQKFVQVDKDVAVMANWGPGGSQVPIAVQKGGYLNVTNPDGVYPVSKRDFEDTYSVTKDVTKGREIMCKTPEDVEKLQKQLTQEVLKPAYERRLPDMGKAGLDSSPQAGDSGLQY